MFQPKFRSTLGLVRFEIKVQLNDPHCDSDIEESGDWLAGQLTSQAQAIASLSTVDACPSVYQLREKILQRRERRARRMSVAASGLVMVSVLGWGWQSMARMRSGDSGMGPVVEGPAGGQLNNVRTVSTGSKGAGEFGNGTTQMVARWLEPVAVEWVGADGQSLGVAGFVTKERTSLIDPNLLSDEELSELRSSLNRASLDPVQDQFNRSLEPAF